MIYKMDSKKLRKLLVDFGSTYYGKTMFLLCYSLFFITFASLITVFIVYIVHKNIKIGSLLKAGIHLIYF